MQNKIHYIGPYYEESQKHRNLHIQLSGLAKMDYVLSALRRTGFEINVFSPAPTQNKFLCHYPSVSVTLDSLTKIRYADTIGGPSIIIKLVSRIWSYAQLLYFLLRIKSNEKILLYHSNQYRYLINLILKIKKINLFIQVEEIYNVIQRKSIKEQRSEIKYLKCADGYIFVNDIIASHVNLNKKPHIVCYGDYRIKPRKSKLNNGHINVVFSGLIGDEKSAVYLSLNAANLLPDNYQLHITGYGSALHIKQMINRISLINRQMKREMVIYHGCLNNTDNADLISTFDIGLATSDCNSFESLFMFPSKISVYLGAGISVLASPLGCIKESRLSPIITLSKDNTPSAIADGIVSIIVNKTDINSVLNRLNEEFVNDLIKLFGNK